MKDSSIEIIKPDFESSLPLTYADAGVRAGFPSPATDLNDEFIDLNQHLIRHPTSTFYARVAGDSMIEEGIDDGDLLIIDRSLVPEDGDLAVCCVDGDFTLKRIKIVSDNRILLMPSNSRYHPIEVTPDNELIVWGIVTNTIKYNRRLP